MGSIYFDIVIEDSEEEAVTLVGSLNYDLSDYGYQDSIIFNAKSAQFVANADGTYDLTYGIYYSNLG